MAPFLAAFLIGYNWSNVWGTRAERVKRALFYAQRSQYTSHELYLHEYQNYETRPLYEAMPDATFEIDYPARCDSRFRVALHILRSPSVMLAGDVEPVLLAIHNGSSRWLRPHHTDAVMAKINLAYHWLHDSPKRDAAVYDGERWVLPRSIAPGEYALAWMRIRAPLKPGAYLLQLDLVEEGVSWFGCQGEQQPQSGSFALARRWSGIRICRRSCGGTRSRHSVKAVSKTNTAL